MILYNLVMFAGSIALSGLIATGFLFVFKKSPWRLPMALLLRQPEMPPDEKALLRERVIQICSEPDEVVRLTLCEEIYLPLGKSWHQPSEAAHIAGRTISRQIVQGAGRR